MSTAPWTSPEDKDRIRTHRVPTFIVMEFVKAVPLPAIGFQVLGGDHGKHSQTRLFVPRGRRVANQGSFTILDLAVGQLRPDAGWVLTFPKWASLCCMSSCARLGAGGKVLEDMGRVVALDMVTNNFDRVPLCWPNQGNLENFLVSPEGEGVFPAADMRYPAHLASALPRRNLCRIRGGPGYVRQRHHTSRREYLQSLTRHERARCGPTYH